MVRSSILKKSVALASLSLMLFLSACSTMEDKNVQTDGISAVGTWGPKEGDKAWESDPWISLTKDGKFTSSDTGIEGSTISGTWSQKGKTVDLIVTSESGFRKEAKTNIAAADRGEVSAEAIELYSTRGEKMVSIPFSSEDPLLSQEMIMDGFSKRNSDRVACMTAQNSAEMPEHCAVSPVKKK